MAIQRLVGVKLPAKKIVIHQPLQTIPAPPVVYVPILQHQGGPGELCVKRGSEVRVGTPLTVGSASMQVPVHSSVSGIVRGIEEAVLCTGRVGTVVRIENDGEDTLEQGLGKANPSEYTPVEIRRLVNESGIVGLGGGTFPTAIKLTPPKPLETVIINGCEGEPILSADHRIMLEKTKELLYGIKAIQIATGAKRVIIALEPHDRSTEKHLRSEVGSEVEVKVVPPVYPVSAEGVLIKAVIGKKLPPGVLPYQMGIGVINVSTAAAIGEALRDGIPLTQRAVTVAGGAVGTPGHYLIRLGTTTQEVLDYVGSEQPHQVLFGGPMMGHSLVDLSVSVVKGTTGIIALSADELMDRQALDCVRCGKCVDVCPSDLTPLRLAHLVNEGGLEEAENWGLKSCMECGSCAYVCPSHIPLVQIFRKGKLQLSSKAAAAKAVAAERRGEKYGA